jgi:hypothetical protein
MKKEITAGQLNAANSLSTRQARKLVEVSEIFNETIAKRKSSSKENLKELQFQYYLNQNIITKVNRHLKELPIREQEILQMNTKNLVIFTLSRRP